MLPTVAEVLALDAVRQGEPKVVAGKDRLDTPVRWVHVIELARAAHLLRGGELVLSTGIALPGDPDGLSLFVADLASVGVSALAVELGSRYVHALPAALVGAATTHSLPLIVFERETQFIEITEAVHARIIDAQLAELRAGERLHQVFTDLAVSGASADEVVRQAAVLAGCPVILENMAHQVIACESAGRDAATLLAGFRGRSRAVMPQDRTGFDPASGWLATVVGARGEDWGRLIMVRGGPPEPADLVLIERAATTLALGRLLDHQRESLERQAHRTVLSALLSRGYAAPEEAEARARELGVPVAGRRLVAVVIRLGGEGAGLAAQARALEVAEATATACRSKHVPALIGSLDDNRVGVLLTLPSSAEPDPVLTRLADQLSDASGDADVIGAGSVVRSVSAVQRSFLEAQQVADVAARTNGAAADGRLVTALLVAAESGRPTTGCPICGSAGCCTCCAMTRGCSRSPSASSARCCCMMRQRAPRLLPVLTAYLEAGGNKADAAKRARLARPTLYERLRQIEQVLGTDLEPAESRLSLHVALLAFEAVR